MKADKQHSALEVIKKEQFKRRAFSVEFNRDFPLAFYPDG